MIHEFTEESSYDITPYETVEGFEVDSQQPSKPSHKIFMQQSTIVLLIVFALLLLGVVGMIAVRRQKRHS